MKESDKVKPPFCKKCSKNFFTEYLFHFIVFSLSCNTKLSNLKKLSLLKKWIQFIISLSLLHLISNWWRVIEVCIHSMLCIWYKLALHATDVWIFQSSNFLTDFNDLFSQTVLFDKRVFDKFCQYSVCLDQFEGLSFEV